MNTYAKSALFVIMAVLVMSIGPCKSTEPTEIPHGPSRDVSPSLGNAAALASKSAASIDSATNSIKTSAHTVKSNADLAESKAGGAKGKVGPHLNVIRAEANNIITEADNARLAGVDVTRLASQLQALMVDVQTLTARSNAQDTRIKEQEKEKAAIQEKLAQALSDKTAALRKAMMYMIIAGSVIIAICLTMFFTGNPKAIKGAVGGIVLVTTAMAVMAMTKHLWLFGIIGGAAVIAVLGVIVHMIMENHKNEKGLEEVVETVEEFKKHTPDDIKDKVFGPEGERGRAGQLQSMTTEHLIRKAKSKLRIAPYAVR